MNPNALIPATTALATLEPEGRKKGILAGANVLMPNLSPESIRNEYALYDNKAAFDAESAEGIEELKKELRSIGYEVIVDRGDYKETANV
jgi:biotin synthase